MRRSVIFKSLCTAKIDKEIKSLSTNFMELVMATFPPVGFHPYPNMYTIFRFEPLYQILLRFSKMPHECIIGMLADDKKTTNAMTSQISSAKNFRQIKKKDINAKNKFFSVRLEHCNKTQLQVKPFKEVSSSFVSGFYTEHGIIGMLEETDIKQIDIVSPFLAAMIYDFTQLIRQTLR